MNTLDLLRKGLDEHIAGRLDSAATFYSAALEAEPENVSALRCLGVLRSQQGDPHAALVLLQAAARFAPTMPEVFIDMGSALRQKGAFDEAVAAFDEAVRLEPGFAEAYFNRGVTFEMLGRPDRAMESYDLALQANPLRHEARFNRAAMLVRSSEFALALPDLVEYLRSKPDSLEAGLLLGRVYRELGRWQEAEKVYEGLGERHPHNTEVFVLLGTCRLMLLKFDGALQACLQALSVSPDHPEAHFKAGVAQLHLWNVSAALSHLSRASALKPDKADVVLHLAIALQRGGLFAAADAAFQRALTLAPDNPDVHWHYADFLLLIGDYQNGWEEFEWRWLNDRFVSQRWEFPQSNWNGEDIRGKTILLHPEQGFGDTLQFVRYVPLVASLGARVLLGTPPELARLLAGFPGTDGVYLSPAQAPEFDVHCPLLSLPHVFRTDLETIPSQVPYLTVDPAIAAPWVEYFARYASTCNVGLIWSGNPGQEHNRHRACRLADLHPLFAQTNVTFFSLQKGIPAKELHATGVRLPVIDLSPQLEDFAETAAVLQQLDLLISTDTGPVHLAGGLGRPTWLLLSAIPDWRWMIGREDSPWYPRTRLFRQTEAGSWADVVQRVSRELALFVASCIVSRKSRGEA
jgi:tetratricopeptide (TPR) repeat protein